MSQTDAYLDIDIKLDTLIRIANEVDAAIREDGAATPEERAAVRDAQRLFLAAISGVKSIDEIDQHVVCPRLRQGNVSEGALTLISAVLETARRKLERSDPM